MARRGWESRRHYSTVNHSKQQTTLTCVSQRVHTIDVESAKKNKLEFKPYTQDFLRKEKANVGKNDFTSF